MKSNKKVVLQQGESDCGVACLLSIINHYKGSGSLENLRKLSGTTITGTTLLGLYQAAKQSGFEAQGCEADITALIEYGKPCVLNVLIDKKLQHYVVFWGVETKEGKEKFLIGDPAKGESYLDRSELEEIWQSKSCLTLEPTDGFVTADAIRSKKKQWIWELIKQDRPLLIIASLIGIVVATLGLTMSLFSQKLIDDVLPQKNYTKLILGVISVLFLLIAKEGVAVLRQYFLLRQSKDFNIRLSDFFYTHLLRLPKPFFDTRKIGELTARLTDTTRIQRVITQLAGNVVVDILVVILSAIFVFIFSVQIGLICVLAIPVFFILVYRYSKKISQNQRAIMTAYAMAEGNYISTLQGVEPIKNSNKENIFSENNKKIYQQFQQNIFSLGKIQMRVLFLANSFSAFFLVGILFFAGFQVINGSLKPGELIAILGACSAMLPGVGNLALVSIPISEAKVAFDRMFEFTNIEPENGSSGKQFNDLHRLEVRNLSFRFPGRKPILHNVTFEVTKGEAIAIIGENGSGKSTLSQIIQRHYQPETGEISLNGTIGLNDIQLTDWRKMVGVVPQNIHIFNGTVIENIVFEDAARDPQKILPFLQKWDLVNFVESLPNSILTIVGEDGINLSGGQKQIVALARALYNNPQLLILDEATAAMDRESEKLVVRLLNKIKKDTAVIFISHRLQSLKSFCDRMYILDKGIVAASGNHDELMKSDNLYSYYFKDYLNS